MSSVNFENTGKLRISGAGQSIHGQRRIQNDDIIFFQTGATQDVGLYVICDGLGGHQNGKRASQLAIGTITGTVTRTLLPAHPLTEQVSNAFLRRLLRQSVQLANHEIIDYTAKHLPPGKKMETTITLALIYQGQLYVAHVGNSRAYLYRDQQIIQLTWDHSLAAELVRRGILNKDDLASHPRRKILLRTLGHAEQVAIDLLEQELKAGDRLLICSDGLWQAFSQPDELAAILNAGLSPAELCEKLVTTATKRDGSDNISAIVVSVEREPGQQFSFPKIVADIWQHMT